MVVGVEQGTGLQHESISLLIERNFLNVDVFQSAHKDGVGTSHGTKSAMVELTHAALRKGAVGISSTLVTTCDSADAVLHDLRSELTRFREFTTPSTTPFTRPKTVWSGKGKEGNLLDDTAMGFMMNLYVSDTISV